jgi:hypothetical protein
MKKISLFVLFVFCMSLFTSSVYAEGGVKHKIINWWEGESEKTTYTAPNELSTAICPEMSLKEIKRPAFEFEAGLNLFETPAGGAAQFHFENYYLKAIHNFSNVLYIYGSYSTRHIQKRDYKGSVYDKEWSYQTVVAGAGWYLIPTVDVFVGLGKVLPKNVNGSEELSFALERGIAWNIPLNNMGYKLRVSWRNIDAGLSDEEAHISASQAEGSTSIFAVSFSLPIGFVK